MTEGSVLPAPFFLHPHLFPSPPSSHLQVKGPATLLHWFCVCKAAKYDKEMTELVGHYLQVTFQSLPCLSFLFSSPESRIHRHYGNLTLEQKGYDKSLCSNTWNKSVCEGRHY
ncbi:hypothetical protein F4604DRAFT_1682847 [Suillus subluteus]|nr:hypothetical protein F4604DRAFT_1682847 [Suillus subluteus]